MKRIATNLLLTLVVLLGNAGESFGSDQMGDCPKRTIGDMHSGTSITDNELHNKMLQCGHRMRRTGNIESAIEFYINLSHLIQILLQPSYR